MHIISRRKLVAFWRKHAQAKSPLTAWYTRAKKAKWKMFADLRQDYPSADQVGRFIVFNIGGNKYRLVSVIHFNRQKVFIRRVLTHDEYDSGDWKND